MPDSHDPSQPPETHSEPHMDENADRAAESDRVLTWAALLGRWTDFARSALALPEHGDAGRVRQSIVSIITLQAVTHALGEVDLLDPSERALALDRAEILIKQHASEIHSVWRGEPLPIEIQSLVHDARHALHAVCSLGVEWRLAEDRLVAKHPGELLMALTMMVADNRKVDLYLPSPGTVMFDTSPVAFARFAAGGDEVDTNAAAELDESLFAMIEAFLGTDLERQSDVIPRQVYRQFDFGAGGPVRDLVMPMNVEDRAQGEVVPAGQPLLIAAMLDGEPQPVPLPPRPTGEAMAPLPVVFEE